MKRMSVLIVVAAALAVVAVTSFMKTAGAIVLGGIAVIVLFIVVHLVMVLLAGPINEIGSMITGRFRVPPDRPEGQDAP